MRVFEIGSDAEIFSFNVNGTEVLRLLPPTATASLPVATSVPAGTLVYDTTADKWKFSNGTAYEAITSA